MENVLPKTGRPQNCFCVYLVSYESEKMKFFPACSIIIVLLSLATLPAFAQYAKLRDFGSTMEGINPYGSVITDGTFLYGTTANGGTNGAGVIYKVQPNGTNFSVIHQFNKTDGLSPSAALVRDGTTLYGTTLGGGQFLQGTIFKVNTDGSGFTTLFDFEYVATGGYPLGPLLSDGAVLYGTTSQGGVNFGGTVFKINKDGTGHTKLVEFDEDFGSSPQGNIAYDGTYIYGSTRFGGTFFDGTVYKVKTDGTGFQSLRSFNGSVEGFSPIGGVFFDGTYLWGTTLAGGSSSQGTLFRLLPDGSGYQTLVSFNGTGNGASPKATLVSDGTFLYGITFQGGVTGNGTLFRILPTGSGFVKLADFSGSASGAQPEGTLLVIGSALYGTKSYGGPGRVGNIFKVDNTGANLTNVYSFEVAGNNPVGDLVSDGTFLYSTTTMGGRNDVGTLYKIKPDGTGFQKILDFEDAATGGRPLNGVCRIGSTLYGMTSQGGVNNAGTIYSIDTDGTDFSKLMDFDFPTTGGYPQGGFVSDGTFLYGMTSSGGANSGGTIFKILPNGTGYTKLRDLTNQNPNGSLILEGGVLYGTTYGGGGFGFGTVFMILPDGDDYFELVEFEYSNGAQPRGSLYSDGTFLYGTTFLGGAHNVGTIFKVKKDGSTFQTLMDFEDGPPTGAYSHGSFISDGTYLYSVASGRGVDDKGTLFRIKPDGTGFDKLLDFNDGSQASGRLFSDGTFLYGTTLGGGKYSLGTLFKRSLADYVSITNFSPESGATGTYVTIRGNDFNPVAANNTVRFNGQAATVISASVSEIVAMVPVGATDGPISVTSGGTDTSIKDFVVTPEARMFTGTVQTCDATFIFDSSADDEVETFIPASAGGKIKVTFTFMDIEDELLVYDGPNVNSPLVATLSSPDTDFEYTSTAPGGELTFHYVWHDASSEWDADIECVGGSTINITSQPDDVEVCEGLTAVFSTAASGVPNITYHWQFSDDGLGWNDIVNDALHYSNATTPNLSVNTTGNFGAGHYRCRVTGNGAADVLTNTAMLTLIAAPAAPGGGGVSEPECGPVVANLEASGGSDGQYKWYDGSGTLINGAVNHIFTTPSLPTTTTYAASINNGQCESTKTGFTVSVKSCTPPVVTTVQSITSLDSKLTIDLTPLIADAENDLDPSTLKIVGQPESGATVSISGLTLTINYAGTGFSGKDIIGIEVCDFEGLCAIQQFSIDVAGDVVVYNAVSPNGDGKNEYLLLEFIDVLPTTKTNTVKIYGRWGDEVFSVSDYDNVNRVFKGFNKNGNKLPSGTYFYRVTFPGGGHEELSGYLQLKQ